MAADGPIDEPFPAAQRAGNFNADGDFRRPKNAVVLKLVDRSSELNAASSSLLGRRLEALERFFDLPLN